MKISTKGRYGLRAMVDLAYNSDGRYISIKNISERQEISENYLEQLISALKKSGLVVSNRGAQGGYMLSLPPEKITIGDILRALEGEIAPVGCVATDSDAECDLEHDCAVKLVWKKMADCLNEVVDSMTLQDLLDEQQKLHGGHIAQELVGYKGDEH